MQRVAVLTSNRNTKRQIARALGSGGLEPIFFDSPDLLFDQLAALSPDLLVVDADTIALAAVEPVLAEDRAARASRPVVLISVGDNRAELLRLIRNQEIGNLVAKHGAIRAVYPALDERELLVTCQKVLRKDIFGIEKYVGLWGTEVARYTLTGMPDKAPFLAEFEQYLNRLDCPARVAPGITTVAEELILNAMVHAPHDHKGHPKYEAIGPRPDLELAPNEYVEVAYCCDGQRLMLSVVDNFGRLSRNKVLSYLARGVEGEKLSVETKAGGAGLGLTMAFGGLHQLIYNIHENTRTEAIAGWYLRVKDANEFKAMSKSMNLFWLAQETPVPASADAAGSRRPVALPGLAASSQHLSGGVLRLAGRIDELTNFSAIARAQVLELHDVESLSSQGVLKWLAMLTGLKGREIEVTGFPEPMVRLAAEVNGLLNNLKVSSVMCPFACPKCDGETMLEVPTVDVLSEVPQECDACKVAMEFQGVPHIYSAFLEAVAEARVRPKQ